MVHGDPFGTGTTAQPPGSMQGVVLHCASAPPSPQVGGVPAPHVWVMRLQTSAPLQARPSLQSAFALQLTHAGTDVANGVKSTLPPATESQPALPGPATHPHQLFSAFTVPDDTAVPSRPTPLPVIEF